jgi:hypothetical protein
MPNIVQSVPVWSLLKTHDQTRHHGSDYYGTTPSTVSLAMQRALGIASDEEGQNGPHTPTSDLNQLYQSVVSEQGKRAVISLSRYINGPFLRVTHTLY